MPLLAAIRLHNAPHAQLTGFVDSGFGPWRVDPVFQEMKRNVQRAGTHHIDHIDSLELCAGLGTAAMSDGCLGLRSFCVGIYDSNRALLPWLQKLYPGSHRIIFCGHLEGDIMRRAPKDFPLAHKIIAGAPCPPWSTKGGRESWKDDRSQPFWRSLEIIIYQANTSGKLQCFILENVHGIAIKQADGSVPLDQIIEYLEGGLGIGWRIDVWKFNSMDFGLPHNRLRVYLIGRRRQPSAATAMPPLDPRSFNPKFATKIPLSAVLDDDLLASNARPWHHCDYPASFQRNLADFRMWMAGDMRNILLAGSIACFSADRTPDKRTKWPVVKRIDHCECLTAHGPPLHILSLGECVDISDSDIVNAAVTHDRPLSVRERGRLQGFPEWFLNIPGNDDKARVTAFGNAMSVPVLAVATYIAVSDFIGLPPLGVSAMYGKVNIPKCISFS